MKSLNDIARRLLAPAAAPADHTDEPRQQRTDDFPPEDEKPDGWDEEYTRLKLQIPAGVNVEDALEYGFYEYKNRYWMRRSEEKFQSISNFTMKVLYLIVGTNSKRIVEIQNSAGKKITVDFATEDLISMEKFHARTQGLGNFLFDGKATDLARIKNKLYAREKPSLEIARLGQYRDRFFAFANGIYDYTSREWLPVDDRGMAMHGPDNFFIPVFGSTTAEDDEDLRNYRKFVHRPNAVTFQEWAALFCKVYGDNGKVGIAFALFSVFSDIIYNQTKAAPMLFLFGQRGSGKGTMANSLLSLWGYAQDPLMLGGASTVVGFMRKLAQFSNAIVWLDEYKNDIGEKKIESLKNIWDRVGYERGVKDSSNRTQVTSVTSSAIVSGQDMPNVEPALFSRTVLCEFRAMQRAQTDVDAFDALRTMESQGITNALLEMMQQRGAIQREFTTQYTAIAATFRRAFAGEEIIERQIVNYAILCACVQVLEPHLRFPFNSAELMQISERYMKAQTSMMRTSNEVQQFFEMLAYLLSMDLIRNGQDVSITGDGLVKVRMTCVIPMYREYSRRQGLKPLDKGTLLNYLQNSDAYSAGESKKSSHRFSGLTNPTSAVVFLQAEIEKLYGVDFKEKTELPDSQSVSENSTSELAF